MSQFKRVLIVVLTLTASSAFAYGGGNGPKNWKWLIQLTGDFQYSQSDADFLSDTSYTQQFATAGVVSLAVGTTLGKYVYLGTRLEYWYAQRKMSGAAGAENNRLDYQGLGLETGFRGGNARSFWMLTGAIAFPLKLGVSSSTGATYTTESTPIAYEARATLGLRLTGTFTLMLTGGYRLFEVKDFANPVPLLGNGATFNMSGPFGGAGIGFTF